VNAPIDIGKNRTGIATSPIDAPRTIEAAEEARTAGPLDGKALEAERVEWARSASPVGTVPPPLTVKGAAKTAVELVEGHKPTVFIDKLGQRLAYERTGVRLYEALLAKYEAAHVHAGGPSREDIATIRNEEHEHMRLVREAIEQLGADPTAITPCADISAVAGLGWVQVLSDPRTTLTQCLDTMLIVESGDVEGWDLLVQLASGLGFDELADRFLAASEVEEEHQRKIRGWVAQAVIGQSGATKRMKV